MTDSHSHIDEAKSSPDMIDAKNSIDSIHFNSKDLLNPLDGIERESQSSFTGLYSLHINCSFITNIFCNTIDKLSNNDNETKEFDKPPTRKRTSTASNFIALISSQKRPSDKKRTKTPDKKKKIVVDDTV